MSAESQIRDLGISEAELPRLSVAAVARRLGVAPGTLRTWDRRYGLGPTEHSAGEHRKYSKADLSRLLYMHKLVISGVSPASAAQLALSYEGDLPGVQISTLVKVDGELVNTLFRTAQALDPAGIEGILRELLRVEGVIGLWSNLLVPTLNLMGNEWESTGDGIGAEHLLSEVIKKVLGEGLVIAQPRNEVPILLACVGEELHSLAISALAAALAEEGINVQFLGARTPIEVIHDVARRTAPAAIFLWAQLPQHTSFDKARALPTVRPAPRIILGGPGWEGVDWRGAVVVPDLVSACREIALALGLQGGQTFKA